MITEPVKRFIVFAFDNYYPSGGWTDSRGSYDTLEEALDRVMELDKEFDFTQAVDLHTGEIVG